MFDPLPGSVHIKALVKRTALKKHRLSDHVLGCIYLGLYLGVFKKVEADIFETCFVRDVKLRKIHVHFGEAFTDPDGNVMAVNGKLFCGDVTNFAVSTYTFDTTNQHPGFHDWVSDALYAGSTIHDEDAAPLIHAALILYHLVQQALHPSV